MQSTTLRSAFIHSSSKLTITVPEGGAEKGEKFNVAFSGRTVVAVAPNQESAQDSVRDGQQLVRAARIALGAFLQERGLVGVPNNCTVGPI